MGIGEKRHCGILRRVYNPQTVSGVIVWSLRALTACNIQGFIIIPVRVTFPTGSESPKAVNLRNNAWCFKIPSSHISVCIVDCRLPLSHSHDSARSTSSLLLLITGPSPLTCYSLILLGISPGKQSAWWYGVYKVGRKGNKG